ncbi:hypothetical protein C8F01DRAFT_1342879 [Mycena amicta]|nr:hypothetical protein C8F01DRAFT_1342879 [Mycena amicta]
MNAMEGSCEFLLCDPTKAGERTLRTGSATNLGLLGSLMQVVYSSASEAAKLQSGDPYVITLVTPPRRDNYLSRVSRSKSLAVTDSASRHLQVVFVAASIYPWRNCATHSQWSGAFVRVGVGSEGEQMVSIPAVLSPLVSDTPPMTVVLNHGSRPCYSLRIMLSIFSVGRLSLPRLAEYLCIDSSDWKVFPAFFVYCDSPQEGNETMSSKETPPAGATSLRSRFFSDDTSSIRSGQLIPPKLPNHVDLDD